MIHLCSTQSEGRRKTLWTGESEGIAEVDRLQHHSFEEKGRIPEKAFPRGLCAKMHMMITGNPGVGETKLALCLASKSNSYMFS